ncbi:MAG: sodium:solute symporter [Gemmatimonadetes bacterium]|nr:sodium:solute symporter [Gemmatimonadota bacterium]
MTFTLLDVAVLIAYLGGVVALGTWMGRSQRGAREYFLAGHSMPWLAICFSVVATETSALTFISIPATAYTGGFWILQLALGYLVGRVAVAYVLLPGYFRGELTTAYALLEQRFGMGARRFASVIFMVTRAFADSVRIFAAAIPIALITGWPYWQVILLVGAVTLVYTWYGGLRAVVWVDVVQLCLYIVGGAAALWVLLDVVPGGWEGIRAAGEARDTFRIFHLEGGPSSATWLVTGLVGGAFLTMATHGVDHLTVQRLMAAPDLAGAQKAVIWSGVLVFLQFALFLVVGAGLLAHYGGREFATPDEVFPLFIIEGLPAGLTGLIVAGILAAAMSTVSSSLNSLASAATHDLYAPVTRREGQEEHLLRVGRIFTLLWAAILIGGAILFRFAQQGTPVVVIALQIASFTFGPLLGGFLLGTLFRHPDERDAVTGIAVAVVVMTTLWGVQTFGGIERVVDTLWFALIGSALTVAVGLASAALRGSRAPARIG